MLDFEMMVDVVEDIANLTARPSSISIPDVLL